MTFKISFLTYDLLIIGRRVALRRLNIETLPEITYNTFRVEYHTQVKNLSLNISQDLSFDIELFATSHGRSVCDGI